MPRRFDDRWQRFPESKPIPVEGGIVTSHRRGAMATQWWSKRFVEVLESFGLGGRMQRGRRYARAGQVMEIAVDVGLLTGQVQGSRSRPYVVTIRIEELTDAQWDSIDRSLATNIGLAAALAGGEVPAELVEVFDEAEASLLPSTWRSLRTRCSCPDSAVPCKHIAAVLYVFADRLDDDPWLLLEWRGRTREQILDLLRSRPTDVGEAAPAVAPWWPFPPGPISDRVVESAGETVGESFPDDAPRSALDRLDPLGIDVLGNPVEHIVAAAYEAFTDLD
ncbi:MAG: hypothetical protein GY708_19420 [Actinomycetia bacterium]|nr:hypothetical protein [Actinomycetes bacterium]MCP4962193.1 hypothetical protein [Actinomycetes bacterium]